MTKIVKSFGSKTSHEIENGGGVINYVSFERLKSYLEIAAKIKPNETIDGIVVSEDGIKIKISNR